LNLVLMRKFRPGSSYSWVMEQFDKSFLSEQVSVMFKDWEESKNSQHGGPLENLLGMVAEYAFDAFLDRMGLTKEKYEWHERTLNHHADNRPWDFRVANELTFEIGAARPTHKLAVLKKAGYKTESNFFVQVQIEHLQCISNIFSKGRYRWFLFDATKQQELECENITRQDGDRVYCYFLQDWIYTSSCHCSKERRNQQASQEW
jgi:hypothetical protein